MTTSLLAPFAGTRAAERATSDDTDRRQSDPRLGREVWTLEIEGMDRRFRGGVEKLMLLLPEGDEGEVWFTRWHRGSDGTYFCRERIAASEDELAEFAHQLALLAEGKFVAQLTQRAYHGVHV